MPSIFIDPDFGDGVDNGDGGIRQCVTAQRRYFPEYGYPVTMDITTADLVLSHGGNLPKVPANIPWLGSIHGMYWKSLQWEPWCYQLNAQVAEVLRQADHIIAPSEWVAQATRRASLINPTVIYHGIDPEKWEPVKNRRRKQTASTYVLWPKTRNDPICTPRPMWEAAKRLPHVQFISTAPLTSDLSPLPNIEVVGRLPFEEGRTLMRNASVYLATTRETFGISTLEAMASAVPVVGFDWGGQREIFPSGDGSDGGLLVIPDDYDALAESISTALSNRTSMGDAARQLCLDRFTWAHQIPQYIQLFDNILSGHQSAWSSTTPTVSVIITAYKLAKYLEPCIRSVLAQTYSNLEVIVVNDASPDLCGAIAERIAKEDSRVRVIHNTTNQYLAEARNIGIRAARGRYILPLDADDLLDPNSVQLLVSALDRDRSCHITYGNVGFFDDAGADTDSTPLDPIADSSILWRGGWPPQFQYRDQIRHRNQLPYCSMYRKAVWERTGGYRSRNKTAEDAEFWCRTTSYGFRPKKVTEALTLLYRNRTDSMSHTLPDWDWTAWFPWSRQPAFVPFVAAGEPVRGWKSWPISHADEPKVAVVIPVGPGHERHLIDALDSVDAQTFRDWEVVVANDTGKPITGWLPPWAKVVEVPTTNLVGSAELGNSGAGSGNLDNMAMAVSHRAAVARNTAIRHSTAPLILPLDADDYLQPNAIESLLSVYAPSTVPYSDWLMDKGDGSPHQAKECSDWSADLLTHRAISPVTCLFSRSDWEAAGGYPEDCPGWEDWAFSLQLASLGVCGVRVPIPLLTYRMSTGTVREEALDHKDRNLAWIHSRFDAEEIKLACRSCGSGRIAAPNPVQMQQMQMQNQAMASVPPSSDMVLMDYTGAHSTFSIVGRGSSTRYRFGNNPGHERRYVHKSDVDFLLSFGVFKPAEGELSPA